MRRPINGKNRPMDSAAEMTLLTRRVAAQWVDQEERESGSRMLAYEVVARSIGASDEWLRKFLSEKIKQPTWGVGWNIITAYRRACERAARNADEADARARELERRCNEVVMGVAEIVAGTSSREEMGKGSEALGRKTGRRPSLGVVESREEA